MDEHSASVYELRLLREIGEIDKKIDEFHQEKLALQRQLMKARRENASLKDVHRKNSVTRAMIEMRVLEALRQSQKPLRTKELYHEARYVNFQLNESTFRTYLHRMKNKNLIRNGHGVGTWLIVDQAAKE